MPSWYDAWADRYAEWFPGVADVPFYVGLAREADGPLVELAVGTGRVAIPVAQATGRRVIGIDSSPAMGRLDPITISGTTSRMLLVVDDPRKVVQRAIEAGAIETSPVAHEHGWQIGRITDPLGHEWEIGKPVVPWPPT